MLSFKSILRSGTAALLLAASSSTVQAQNLMGVTLQEPGDTNVSMSRKVSLNKSTVIELGSPASEVVITNPEIADAVVQTSKRIIFRGVEVGETNAFIYDRSGNLLLNLEIIVDIDTSNLDDLISKYVPDSRIAVEMVNGSLIVSGAVDSMVQADQVMRIATAFAGSGDDVSVVNMMSVNAKDQVMLEVRIVEMQRTVVKQLGINLSATTRFNGLAGIAEAPLYIPDALGNLINSGETTIAATTPFSNSFGFTSSNVFNVAGSSLGGLSTNLGYVNTVNGVEQSSAGAAIDALERVGIVRTLAEPNIMAVSGESAKFLAGGEFPVPVGQDENGNITIEFKPYGVGLGFTPVVLSEGRISLRISTEISELSNQGAFQGQSIAGTDGSGNVITATTLTIPALVVRRAESTVELPSGGSTMLAGLIQSRSRQTLDQLPGIKKLPVIGTLFQSRDFINEETEMVVIVTPYLVDPARKDELKTPADGFVNASDPRTILFGKLNELYTKPGEELTAENYTAPVGFIEE